MTDFECPRHGTYAARAGLPAGINVPTSCGACRAAAEDEIEQAQRAYGRALKAWQRWERSEIPERYRRCTVESWIPQSGQEAAARMVRAWLDDVHARWEEGEGLLLMGAPGVGKTHLLAGLATSCIAAGYTARYASWPDVWDRCRPPFEGSPEVLMRTLASVHFLALDEIGLRTATEKEQARLFELIDTRYRQSLPTLVATNATQESLEMIGERTADRLLDACIPIAIPGDSNRLTALATRDRSVPMPITQPERHTITTIVSMDGADVQRTHQLGAHCRA